MSALAGVLGAAAAGAVVGIAAASAPAPVRLPPARAGARPLGPTRALASTGARIRSLGRLHGSPLGDRALAAAAMVLTGIAVLTPPLALLGGLSLWLQARVRQQRRTATSARAVLRALPDSVDLLLLCTGAGLSLPLAHPLVAARTPPPLGAALAAAQRATEAGASRADALLVHLPPLGERAAALAHVLVDHLRYGVPLAPALERLSLELRLDRRRRGEQDARRVPVRLLGPLVACVLPAFALLTVVPLLAASLRALPA